MHQETSIRPTNIVLLCIAWLAACGGTSTSPPPNQSASGSATGTSGASGSATSGVAGNSSAQAPSGAATGGAGTSTQSGSSSGVSTGSTGYASGSATGDAFDAGNDARDSSTDAQGSFTVGPAGATLDLDGRGTLIIPSGAFASDTVITAEWEPTSGPTNWRRCTGTELISLQPAGLKLAVPATLVMNYDGAPSMPSIMWSAPDAAWTALSSTATGTTVTAEISELGSGICAQVIDEAGPSSDSGVQACTIDSDANVSIDFVSCYPLSDLPSGSCSGAGSCSFCAALCGAQGPRVFYSCTCSSAGDWQCEMTGQDATVCAPDASTM